VKRKIHGYLTWKLWNLDDKICEIENDNISDPLLVLTEWARKALCFLFGHYPIADQCNIPDHDYCAWCNARTPGMAEGRA
jgi:hypothetical protein